MKQVLQNFNTGALEVHDVPAPILNPDGVLVRTHYSLISAGTEGGTVRLAKMNLLQKARSRPDLVKKVLNVARTDGLFTAFDAVVSNLDSPVPLGYSAAGEIVEVGERVTDLKVGDRVACFGAFYANHAEINAIPRNLCVRLPEGVDLRQAAFCMLGAIALGGVRQAKVDLGSTALVIGLGLIGQIAVQLLKAAGCRVFGVDLDPDKVERALLSGADGALVRSDAHVEEAIAALSDGLGVDATIIAAATSSTDPIELAGRATRPRGRVVALGRLPYELPRQEYLFKELEFVTTLAYGPGVNDPDYEQKGHDYPAAHVRWSGNRNVQAVVNLVAAGKLDFAPLVTHEFAIDEADQAFALLTGENAEPSIGILLRYPVEAPYTRPTIHLSKTRGRRPDRPGVGVIGAGSHAVSFMFDAIKAQKVDLRGILSAGGFKSKWYGEKYGFAYAASDPQELFQDADLDAVFILSRHNSHAALTVQALEHGKDVFVEKPLCLTAAELDAIIAAQAAHGGRVMVGYNRRFAPLGRQLREQVANHAQPLAVTYRMNAGFRPQTHWLHDLEIGGGLILGEGVHFIDFIQYLVGALPVRVFAQSVHTTTGDILDADNVTINLQYADGSMGVVSYLSGGDKSFGRERIEVFGDNTIAVLEDWRSLVFSKDGKRRKSQHLKQDKGFQQEVATFIQAIIQDEALPMSFAEVVAGMRAALGALESLRTGQPINIT